MDLKTINFVLDVILIAASIWMLVTIRGLGGLVGRTLTLIMIGAIILGFAHLITDVMGTVFKVEASLNNFIHRLIVLLGFLLVAFGFQQVKELTR